MLRSMWSYIFGNQEPPPPPPAPSAPPPELDQPWRDMKWDQKKVLEEKLRKFKVKNPSVQQVKILVSGPVGSGKSSFINSVNNVFQHRITCDAPVATISEESFTKEYETHSIEGEDGKPLAFVFNDIMGLQHSACGINEQDIVRAIQGFIHEGYNFEEQSKNLSQKDPKYRSNPELKDQIFCLVYVLPANNVSLIEQRVIDQMKFIRQEVSNLKIPQVIIMTKPDIACPLVKENIRKIYTSKKIKEKMEVCSNLLALPVNHIFPVKNYHEEIDTEDNMDALILKALDQIVNIANDALKKRTPKY